MPVVVRQGWVQVWAVLGWLDWAAQVWAGLLVPKVVKQGLKVWAGLLLAAPEEEPVVARAQARLQAAAAVVAAAAAAGKRRQAWRPALLWYLLVAGTVVLAGRLEAWGQARPVARRLWGEVATPAGKQGENDCQTWRMRCGWHMPW